MTHAYIKAMSGPGRHPVRTAGWLMVRRPMRVGDVHRDESEARQDFAGEPWAEQVRYLGLHSRWHCWERPPDV